MTHPPPSSLPPKASYSDQAGAGFAMATAAPRRAAKSVPVGYTAGGGLVVGILAGFLLISGGGDTKKAVAAADPVEAEESAEAQPELEQLAAVKDEAGSETDTEAAVELASEPLDLDTEPTETEVVEVEPVDEAVEDEAVEDEAVEDEAVEDEAVEDEAVEEPEPIVAQLTFDVTPPEALALLSVTVDGVASSADSFSLEFAPKKKSKRVRIVAVAEGYRKFNRGFTIKGDTSLTITMRKKPAPGAQRRGGKRGKKGKGPGGLISL